MFTISQTDTQAETLITVGQSSKSLHCVINLLILCKIFNFILTLGDSITQSNRENFGYRYRLWTKLIDDSRSFDMVGSITYNFGGNPSWPQHMGLNFDQDHEGHWGWRTDEILNGRLAAGSLTEWLDYYTPDVVLIHLGTNDVYQNQSTTSTVEELKQVIDMLRADNPDVIIFVAKLIPTASSRNTGIIELNAEMEGIAALKSTAQSPVHVVDHYTGFDAITDTYDGIHPNAVGEKKMAENWNAAMWTYLNPCIDGFDNDNDGFIDFTADPDCTNPQGSEFPSCPGNSGPDNDLDGMDLAAYIADPSGATLADFAAAFGRTDCP